MWMLSTKCSAFTASGSQWMSWTIPYELRDQGQPNQDGVLHVLHQHQLSTSNGAREVQRNVRVLVLYAGDLEVLHTLSSSRYNQLWHLIRHRNRPWQSRQWPNKQEAIANGTDTVGRKLPIWSIGLDGDTFTRTNRWHKSPLVLWHCMTPFWNQHAVQNVLLSTSGFNPKRCPRNPKKCPIVLLKYMKRDGRCHTCTGPSSARG
jgi:hypothetical protein